jgi:hypothetical protein
MDEQTRKKLRGLIDAETRKHLGAAVRERQISEDGRASEIRDADVEAELEQLGEDLILVRAVHDQLVNEMIVIVDKARKAGLRWWRIEMLAMTSRQWLHNAKYHTRKRQTEKEV